MLTIFFSVCMYSIAEREKRRGWLWGLLTFLIAVLMQTFLIGGYWGALLGLLISYGAMTYMNLTRPVKKGVMWDVSPPLPDINGAANPDANRTDRSS